MARRNRVTPLGELIEHPARGLVFGNRGCLHDAAGVVRRHHAGRRWIACRLEFKGRRRELMQPGRYTELFFLDDATAMAAGHRPCAECRRADYEQLGAPSAAALDERLAGERGRPWRASSVPDGAFVLRDGEPWLACGDALLHWTPAGYDRAAGARPPFRVLTPPTLVDLLRTGWSGLVPLVHPSAASLMRRSGAA